MAGSLVPRPAGRSGNETIGPAGRPGLAENHVLRIGAARAFFVTDLRCVASLYTMTMWWRVWIVLVAAVLCSFLLPRSQAGVVGVGEKTYNWYKLLGQ